MANEKRLIDANALKQMFDEREADDVEMYGGVHIIECFPADDAKEIVDQMPTVDAVEVVRCKDCKHSRPTAWYSANLRCTHLSHMSSQVPYEVPKEHFCSYGERREGE